MTTGNPAAEEYGIPEGTHHERKLKRRKQCVCDVEIGHRSATVCHLGNIARWVSQKTQTVGEKLIWDPVEEAFKNNTMANAMLDWPRRKEYELPKV